MTQVVTGQQLLAGGTDPSGKMSTFHLEAGNQTSLAETSFKEAGAYFAQQE